MYPRRRWYGPRRLGWRPYRRPFWGWRRPLGCWWLVGGLFGMIVLLAVARLAFRLF